MTACTYTTRLSDSHSTTQGSGRRRQVARAEIIVALVVRGRVRRDRAVLVDVGDVVRVIAQRALRARIQGFGSRQARIATKSGQNRAKTRGSRRRRACARPGACMRARWAATRPAPVGFDRCLGACLAWPSDQVDCRRASRRPSTTLGRTCLAGGRGRGSRF